MEKLETVQLDSFQQAELANLGCDDLAARESLSIDDIKTELSKLQSDVNLQSECKRVLSLSGKQTALLMTEIASGDIVEKPKGDEKRDSQKEPPENANLPVAPTTAFNVMRLVQLGYFPKDYAPLWGDKPNMFHKGTQMFYVLPGKMGEWTRTKANTVFQKKFDRDSAYKDFMRDLTKQMNAELDDWFKQNKLSNKANIDAARQSLDAMNASFTAGKNTEAMTHFDSLTEKMGMRINGKWHEKSPADLAAAHAEQDGKTTSADARVQKAKDQKILRDGQLKGAKDDLKAKKADIDLHYTNQQVAGNTLDEKWRADNIKPSDIEEEVKKLNTEKAILENRDVVLSNVDQSIKDAVNARSDIDITNQRNTIGYEIKSDTYLAGSELDTKHNEIVSKKSEIDGYEKPKGFIEIAKSNLDNAEKKVNQLSTSLDTKNSQLTTLQTLLASADKKAKSGITAQITALQGDITNLNSDITKAQAEIVSKDTELSTKRSELYSKTQELTKLEQEKKGLIAQSDQNTRAFNWLTERNSKIAKITAQITALNDLKPLVEAKNKSTKRLGLIEKSILKADEVTTKREQLARDAHMTASPIHDALDKLNDPTVSRSERLALNDKLNELLAAKKPEAERIERLLKGSQAEKNQAIRELQGILDTRGKGVDYFKSSLDSVESKIKGLQTEAARIMTEYDRQAGTGDVEALRKKMEVDIGKINKEIERYNADARVKYGVAAATLTPVQLESLHLQTKLGGFFDLMNKGTTKIESLGSTAVGGKAMRGVYGVMTLAGLGQIGATGMQSGGKQAALDAADMGIGFIPVVGGAYDIIVGAGQFIKGSELVAFDDNKAREISKTDALKRIGFGILGLIPIAGQAFKAAAKGEKLVEVARKVAVVERTAQVTGQVLILNEAKNLGVALYDATGSVVAENGGIKKTAESIYTGTRFPINTAQ